MRERSQEQAEIASSMAGLLLEVAIRWRTVILVALTTMTVAGTWKLLSDRAWTVTVSLAPQSGGAGSASLRGLAAQFGIDAGGEPSQSPEFYQEVLKTRDILHTVAMTRYRLPAGDSGTLVQFWRIKEEDSTAQRDRAVQKLSDAIAVSASRRTGIVTFSVTTKDGAVSVQVAEVLLRELSAFNQRRRQSRAGAERRFVEQRTAAARTDLARAEEQLEAFLVRNRSFRDSPQLQVEYERLQRLVSQRQTLFTTLQQAYEQARIDEVRDTPVFTVIQPPRMPPKPGRGTVLAVLMAGIIGSTIAVLAILSRLLLRALLAGNPDLARRASTLRGAAR